MFDATQLRLVLDGDAKVEANASVANSLPAAGAPIAQSAAVKLSYHMAGGWKFIRIEPKAPEPISDIKPLNLQMWVYGDGQGCSVRLRFVDATGQTFQPDGPKIDWKGWRCVSFPMVTRGEHELAHWGGANDGEIRYPIKWDSIFLLDNTSREAVEGEIYLSAPTLDY